MGGGNLKLLPGGESRFNGTVEWNSGIVEWWISGMIESRINNY